MSKKSFLGTGWSFPIRFDSYNKSVIMVSEEEDIRESLRILLSTRPGERIVNPNYGCRIHDYLFAPFNNLTVIKMEDAIKNAILFFEPRIDLEDLLIEESPQDKGHINVTLTYSIRRVNIRTNVVFPFYKLEGTNILERI